MGIRMIELVYHDRKLEFETNVSLFSPKAIDRGTLAMLSHVNFQDGAKVLDIGCGYGVAGIVAAGEVGEQNVVMSDISEIAVRVAKSNAQRNGYSQIKIVQSNAYEEIADRDFSLILSNPPYHTDFSVAKHFIEGGYQKLRMEGSMVMVVKRLTWYQNKMKAVFGKVLVEEQDGYYILTAKKQSQNKKNLNRQNRNRQNENQQSRNGKIKKKMSKKLMRKYKKIKMSK